MEATDDQKKSCPAIPLPFPQCSTDIPQMVITSADDTSEEPSNVTECTLVLIPPAKNGAEPVSTAYERPEIDFEDISIVVRDVVSKCADSVPHSASQRPLRIELDKNGPQEEITRQCPTPPPLPPPVAPTPSPPPPPPSGPPSAMQRPLVFEGGPKTDSVNSDRDLPLMKLTAIQGELNPDAAALSGARPLSEVISKDEVLPDETKKESSHGVKKFLDNLFHTETHENISQPTEPLASLKDSELSSDIAKNEKSPVMKFFHSSKDRKEQPPSPEKISDSKESTPFKFFHSSKSESSKDRKEPLSSPEKISDSKESTPFKFFHSSKSESSKDKKEPPPSSDKISDGKESTSFKFFHSSKPDSSKDKKEISLSPESKESTPFRFFHSSKSESSKDKIEPLPSTEKISDGKESTSFKFFHSSKTDSSKDTKEVSLSPESKESTTFKFFHSSKSELFKDKTEPIPSTEKISDGKESTTFKFFHSYKTDSSKDTKEVPLSPESKESTPFKFFHSSKSESSKDKIEQIPSLEKISDGKESTSFKFFHSSKTDSSKDKKEVPLSPESKESTTFKLFHSSKPESTKDKNEPLSPSSEKLSESSKESASFSKDAKQSIKSFFDTFKHESSEQTDKGNAQVKSDMDHKTSQEMATANAPQTSDHLKDATDSPIKAFFDSFKHESSDQKHKIGSCPKSASQPDFGKKTNDFILPDAGKEKETKESASFGKDTKQNIKAFFDTFKHDPSHPKQKIKTSASHPDVYEKFKESDLPEQESLTVAKEKETSSFAKDTKQNIKSFFDSFKHESEKPKESQIEPLSIKEHTQASEVPRLKEDDQYTISSTNTKPSFSNNLKSDTKQNKTPRKKPTLSEPDLSKDTGDVAHSNLKRPLKKFFSFKHVDGSGDIITSESSGNINGEFNRDAKRPAKGTKSVKLDLTPTYSLDGAEYFKAGSSFCYVNGYENEPKERAQSVPSEMSCKDENFSISSPELKNTEMALEATSAIPEAQKESHHGGLKKFFDSFKHEKPDVQRSAPHLADLKSTKDKPKIESNSQDVKGIEIPVKEKKHKSIKRSLSDKVNREEVMQNFKGFFDSISHRSSSRKSVKETEHIYDTVEPRPEVSISPIPAIQVSPESMEEPPKSILPKKESQGVKKLFSSFRAKESSSEPVLDGSCHQDYYYKDSSLSQGIVKTGVLPQSSKTVKDKLVVQGSMETDILPQSSKTGKDNSVTKGSLKTDILPKSSKSVKDKSVAQAIVKTDILSQHSKTSLIESTSPKMNATIKTEKDVTTLEPSLKTNETATPKPEKSSMFDSIGENILALKDKMMHGKEKRKSHLEEDSTKAVDVSSSVLVEPSKEISLDVSSCKDKLPKCADKVKPAVPPAPEKLSTDSNMDASLPKDIPSKIAVVTKIKPAIPQKPTQNKAQNIQPTSDTKAKKEDLNTSPSTPNSLYDTCCLKLAILLRDKAIDIVTDHTKSPPPKPPKPSAEAVARARAAAVSRRLADAQRMGRSIGDSFPTGCEAMRFADDDTESSCDYKDVDNFDYIMDYELINRFKLEKLDTFSTSTASGMTSYYSAENMTLTGESFSDAIMETVSLSSNVSPNLKQLSSSDKSDPKCISKDLSVSKPAVKKVPPPIPPKPAILQNISKLKSSPYENAPSQCVNGLSLSPRLQNKFAKDPAMTQKRPLMVADIKGTQFSSLPHSKSKSIPKKPLRSFDTVLKNESLKNVSSEASSLPSHDTTKSLILSSNLPTDSLSSNIKAEKRTKSPPRPPPPNLTKKSTPQRPPPPIKSCDKKYEEMARNIKLESEIIQSETSDSRHLTEISSLQKPTSAEITSIDETSMMPSSVESKLDDLIQAYDKNISNSDIVQKNGTKESCQMDNDELNNNLEEDKAIADSLNNNIEVIQEIQQPKPPPRNRRIRSRTVEIVPLERSEERHKRSQSLSDVDIEKRVTFLEAQKSEADSKSLYSAVNKDGKRLNGNKNAQSSPDLVSGRPLPAPPPPPRKFRSLERKSKRSAEETEDRSLSRESFTTPPSSPIKPPSRRRKTEKERFLSLRSESKKEMDSSCDSLKHVLSAPSKPDRRAKEDRYDVNANISTPRDDSPISNIPVDSTDSLGKSKSISSPSLKSTDQRKRSHSSWYDEEEFLDTSWDMVDVVHTPELEEEFKYYPKVPVRRKSDSKRKMRETSKFYVNMEHEQDHPPLVDKETSPLPLECSEKSVQTSLETLSQGIVSSRDEREESEDTDELLDLAQTLQKELSTIINRHKFTNESSEETPSPSLSEKHSAEDQKATKKISLSVRSSTSEVWPLTSSDESDAEREDASNLTEATAKRRQKKIFYIAQEIMTSEEMFVDALKLLNVNFKAAVEAASKEKGVPIIPEEALSQILNHLPQLQHLNENLLMELKDRIENWDKTDKIADIIVKMGPFLKLYSWYIHDFESNVALLEDCKRKYPLFAQVVKEFEMSPLCKRLALNHYMLKPIQRIPQYRLLLQEYFHHLSEDSADYLDTVTALQIVSEVANHANNSMKHGDNAQKLISIQNSIMGHREIVKPGRMFVKEGELMKLSRKGMQPRWFVLFNDLLLYLTPVQQGLYRINHELPLTGMKVAIPIQQDYQNEFSIISVTRSFTLAARSPEERQEWIIVLTKAIEENASKRSTFTNTRLHQKAQDKTSSEEEGAFVLGKKAPVWIPDARVTMCQLCTSEFTVTFRRHHCRACGKVVCSICSSHRISLPYLGNRIARVCDECHMLLGQGGSSGCTESGETDSENQQIAVKSHLRTDNRHHPKKNKRFLPSVLKEVCANDQGSTISGYLHKKSGKSWKRDWFVIKDKVLYEYKASEDVAALRSVPLLGYQIELFTEAYESIDPSLLFQLTHPGQAPIMFYADTVGSTERWILALKTATVLE